MRNNLLHIVFSLESKQKGILLLLVAQRTVVKSGAVQSGQMQCILVKSDEFENLYPLLYILLKSCLCCCSLATLALQQLETKLLLHWSSSQLHEVVFLLPSGWGKATPSITRFSQFALESTARLPPALHASHSSL